MDHGPCELESGEPLGQCGEDHVGLGAGEHLSGAAVDAAAEGEVLAEVDVAVEPEGVGLVEDERVAVPGADEQDQDLAGGDVDSADGDRLGGGADDELLGVSRRRVSLTITSRWSGRSR